jgi:hypothetical protein
VGAAGAADAPSGTRCLAVIVIADMHYEVRPVASRSQRNRGKRPRPWVVAILDRTPFESTTGVAKDNDASHLLRKNRYW